MSKSRHNMNEADATDAVMMKTYEYLISNSQILQVKRTCYSGYCWQNRNEFLSEHLLWAPTNGHTNFDRAAKTYMNQLCGDIRRCQANLVRVMDDRDRWNLGYHPDLWWW